MPKPNPDKQQLNMFLPNEVAERFRERAKFFGHGRQASPYLEQLMALDDGDIGTLYKVLARRLAYGAPLNQYDIAKAKQMLTLLQGIFSKDSEDL